MGAGVGMLRSECGETGRKFRTLKNREGAAPKSNSGLRGKLGVSVVVAVVCGAMSLFVATRGLAQEGEKKLLTPEASLNMRAISDLQYSPDGKRLVFVVTEPAKGQNRKRHIWIHEAGADG